jgi:hypothetical protein
LRSKPFATRSHRCTTRGNTYAPQRLPSFALALKLSVLTVTSPSQALKPKCVDALRRIFKLCDVNKDGVLDPTELNDFQVRPITPSRSQSRIR